MFFGLCVSGSFDAATQSAHLLANPATGAVLARFGIGRTEISSRCLSFTTTSLNPTY